MQGSSGVPSTAVAFVATYLFTTTASPSSSKYKGSVMRTSAFETAEPYFFLVVLFKNRRNECTSRYRHSPGGVNDTDGGYRLIAGEQYDCEIAGFVRSQILNLSCRNIIVISPTHNTDSLTPKNVAGKRAVRSSALSAKESCAWVEAPKRRTWKCVGITS